MRDEAAACRCVCACVHALAKNGCMDKGGWMDGGWVMNELMIESSRRWEQTMQKVGGQGKYGNCS